MVSECKKKLNIITAIVIAGFFVSVIYHYALAYYHGKGYPLNTFLFNPKDYFNDFYNVYKQIETGQAYATKLLAYLPFAIIIFYPLTFLSPGYSLFLLLSLFCGLLCYQNWQITLSFQNDKIERIKNTFVLSFMIYPVLFVVDRANIEILLYAFLCLFFYFKYIQKSNVCLIFLAFAISMKLYPVFYLLLFGYKKWKKVVFTLGLSALLTLSSYFVLGFISGDGLEQTIRLHLGNLSSFNDVKFTAHGLQHSHTLWSMLVGLNHILGISINIKVLSAFYPFFAAAVFFIFACSVVFAEMDEWQKVFLLTVIVVAFNYISFDYTLISLIIPMTMFIRSEVIGKYSVAYAIMFGILMVPVDYYYYFADVSISTIIYPMVMLLMAAFIIYENMIFRKFKRIL